MNNPENLRKSLLTGFIIYAAEVRKQVKDKNPIQDFAFISKLVGAQWRALPHDIKLKYRQKAIRHNIRVREKNLKKLITPCAPKSSKPGLVHSSSRPKNTAESSTQTDSSRFIETSNQKRLFSSEALREYEGSLEAPESEIPPILLRRKQTARKSTARPTEESRSSKRAKFDLQVSSSVPPHEESTSDPPSDEEVDIISLDNVSPIIKHFEDLKRLFLKMENKIKAQGLKILDQQHIIDRYKELLPLACVESSDRPQSPVWFI